MKRRNLIRTVVWVCCALACIWSCAFAYQQSMVIPITSVGAHLDAETQISRWILLGPYPIAGSSLTAVDQNRAVGINNDYFLSDGVSEATIDNTALRKLWRRIAFRKLLGVIHGDAKGPTITHTTTGRWFIDLEALLGRHPMVISYAVAEIDSSQERRVAIAAGSADGMKCWLNGNVIVTSAVDEIRDLQPYSSVVATNLRKGANFLTCKVDRLTFSRDPGWAYRVALVSLPQARHILHDNLYRSLDTLMVPPGGYLHPLLDFFDAPVRGDFALASSGGKPLFHTDYLTNSNTGIKIPDLPIGVYRCSIRAGDMSFENDIYVGFPEQLEPSMLTHVGGAQGAAREPSGQLTAWLYRIHHLMTPEHFKPHDLRWQFKVINAARDIETATHSVPAVAPDINAALSLPGFHIIAYRSHVDGATQYYGAHLPGDIVHGNLLPVLLNLDGVEGTPRPFLESTRVSDVDDETEKLNINADRYGMLIVDPFGRGNARGAPVQEEDILEVLADVMRRYKLDPARIYVAGSCEGGREAIALAERFPSVFAAVTADIPSAYGERPGQVVSRQWIDSHDIAHMAYRLRNMPVMVQHGDHNDHNPLTRSQSIVSACREAAGNCELQVLPESYPRYSQIDRMENMIKFLVGKTRNTSLRPRDLTDSEIKYSQADWIGSWFLQGRRETDYKEMFPRGTLNEACPKKKTATVSGPIADIFTGPVLVVVGTHGPREQQVYARQVATLIEEAWANDFFTRLPEITDVSLRPYHLQNYNLLIVGSEKVNSGWSWLKSRPFTSRTSRPALSGKPIPDPDLVFESVSPNPLNHDRYVATIATSSEKAWQIRDPRLWFAEGSFDYSIYSTFRDFHVADQGTADRCWMPTRPETVSFGNLL